MYCDVLVLGGGPAGAASAMTLAKLQRRVVLVEWRAKPGLKPGEYLPPGAWPHLAALGLAERFEAQNHLRCWAVHAVWGGTSVRTQDFSFHPFGSAWHLDRTAFEQLLLVSAGEDSVHIVRGASLAAAGRDGEGRWRVSFDSGDCFRPRYVVDATGRAASFAKRCGAVRKRVDRLVALTGNVPSAGQHHALAIESTPGGWWYAATVPGERSVAALLTDGDLIPSGRERQHAYWRDALSQTVHVRQFVSPSRGTDSANVCCATANTGSLSTAFGDGWVAVGDAVAAFDPLSSLGLSHALETGRLAGLAVHGSLEGDGEALNAYERIIVARIGDVERLRRGFYAMEQRWPSEPFWSRRIARAVAGGVRHPNATS